MKNYTYNTQKFNSGLNEYTFDNIQTGENLLDLVNQCINSDLNKSNHEFIIKTTNKDILNIYKEFIPKNFHKEVLLSWYDKESLNNGTTLVWVSIGNANFRFEIQGKFTVATKIAKLSEFYNGISEKTKTVNSLTKKGQGNSDIAKIYQKEIVELQNSYDNIHTWKPTLINNAMVNVFGKK